MKSISGSLFKFPDWSRYHIWLPLEQRWSNLGLRAKMSTIVTVGLVGLLSIVALMGITTARQATLRVLNERMMLARLSATTLDSTLRHVKSTLVILAEQPILRDPEAGKERIAAILDTAFTQIDIFSHAIYLLDGKDEPLAVVTGSELENSQIYWGQVEAVREARRSGEISLSLLGDGFPLAVIAMPVADVTGQRERVLLVELDLNNPEIFPVQNPLDIGKTGTLDVIDSSGLVLISSLPERVMTNVDRRSILDRLFIAYEPGVGTCLGCSNEDAREVGDEVIAFAPLSQALWGVVIRQNAAEAFAPVRSLTLQNLILGMLSLAGALGLVWVTTSSVINPVQSLTKATQRIADGNLEAMTECAIHEKGRYDEVGTLAHSFEAMCSRLKGSMDEIQSWNRELDDRVRERTEAALAAQHEAQSARDDLRAVIDALSDELVVIDVESQRILQVNKAAQDRYNGKEAIIGKPCYQMFHNGQSCQPPNCECPIPQVLSRGESVMVTHVHHSADGSDDNFVDIVASPMRDAKGNITRIVELSRDVTEEKKIKDSLVRRNQQLSTLNTIATTVNQSLNLEDILVRTLDEVLRLTEIDVGAVFLQEDQLGSLKLLAYRGLSKEAAQLASQFGMLDGSCGGVIEKGQVIIVPDISNYRGKRARMLKREKLSTLVHVPLTAKGCTLGSMCVGIRQQREVGVDEQDLLTSIGSQIAVAIENARLYAEVQHKEQIRGGLFKKAIAAQEEERKRIARELHDDTSQALTALLYAAEEATEMENRGEVKQRLTSMHALIQRMIDSVHKLIFDLRPTTLDHLGLVPSLRWFANSRLGPKGVRVLVEEVSDPRRLPIEVETALFRVIQEAINNIARHAAARRVNIYLDFGDEEVAVDVVDDGVGFDLFELSPSPDNQRGLGLMGMQERIDMLGGDLEINSIPGQGTQIHIRVPCSERSTILV